MSWDALKLWSEDAIRLDKLSGGSANEVWKVRVNGTLAVARLGKRSELDLAWESNLLHYLDHKGITVPLPIRTRDGRQFAEGLTVMRYIEGQPAKTQQDWAQVAKILGQVHRLTAGWPQRPGWCSSTDLLQRDKGTRVDLTAMPVEAVARCRAAWSRFAGQPTCVVHGNPANAANVLVSSQQVALIDWDEAHVDVPALDLVLPHNAAHLEASEHYLAAQASAAWEAAVCWRDAYAIRRLAEVNASDQ